MSSHHNIADRPSPSWYHKEKVRSRNISSLYNPYACLPEDLHRWEQSTREKLWTSTSQRELRATQLLAHTRGNHLARMCFSNAAGRPVHPLSYGSFPLVAAIVHLEYWYSLEFREDTYTHSIE
ncbi:uncharacterized protein EI90DRAFT_3122828 [Cantharellus anzutake]|uniref:uncharacterized protein n=1 Tax=Cantharellus anzutake TaxID=1750568 RepID=UPI001908D92F|nr:uncharacterized protein EI90DRAFT_3122828 [Cantharellus anzutake]KAF8332358.1 hypothetical protein EI90DRAFT_3122828 [Cantharellus anzutake]